MALSDADVQKQVKIRSEIVEIDNILSIWKSWRFSRLNWRLGLILLRQKWSCDLLRSYLRLLTLQSLNLSRKKKFSLQSVNHSILFSAHTRCPRRFSPSQKHPPSQVTPEPTSLARQKSSSRWKSSLFHLVTRFRRSCEQVKNLSPTQPNRILNHSRNSAPSINQLWITSRSVNQSWRGKWKFLSIFLVKQKVCERDGKFVVTWRKSLSSRSRTLAWFG